jgi:hypothetical protein
MISTRESEEKEICLGYSSDRVRITSQLALTTAGLLGYLAIVVDADSFYSIRSYPRPRVIDLGRYGPTGRIMHV